jgi:hypothetical protein
LQSAEQKRYSSEDSKTAVKEPPRDRDFMYMPCDESKRDHTSAGYETEGDHPLVTNGIAIRTDEGNGNDQMGERQPISSISKERKVLVRNR